MDVRPILCAGDHLVTEDVRPILSPFDGSTVARVAHAGPEHVARALDAAADAADACAALPAHARARILEAAARAVAARQEAFAQAICREAGKPISAARVEAARCLDTFADAAYAARTPPGHVEAMDAFEAGEGRTGLVMRVPVGLVSAITPFNFPLNLVAHKLLPAVAAGCPIVLKPAPQTPTPALWLADTLIDAGWPAEAISVLPVDVAHAGPLVTDPRIRLLTFTGSAAVGWRLRQQATRARVALELGGNAATYVAADADLDLAVARVVAGGFGYAGQTCISVQRVLVHRSLYAPFLDRLIDAVDRLVVGDPADEDTVVGPVIREADAARIVAWIEAARAAGATVHTGGGRRGTLVEPTVLTDVPTASKAWCGEVFGPVVSVAPVDTDDEALAAIDASPYGLQAGLFTQRVDLVMRAARRLHVGGLIHNDASAFRVDGMPYGGVRDSGIGREGPRHALAEYTEPRIVVLRG